MWRIDGGSKARWELLRLAEGCDSWFCEPGGWLLALDPGFGEPDGWSLVLNPGFGDFTAGWGISRLDGGPCNWEGG